METEPPPLLKTAEPAVIPVKRTSVAEKVPAPLFTRPPFVACPCLSVMSEIVSDLPDEILNGRYKLLPSIMVEVKPAPVIVRLSEIAGRAEVRVIIPVFPEAKVIVLIVAEAFAVVIAQRKEPESEVSERFTTMTDVGAGTVIDAAEFAVSEPIELVLVTATRICFATSSELITYVEDVAPDMFAQVHEEGVQDCH